MIKWTYRLGWGAATLIWLSSLALSLWAKTDKPTLVAEDFFQALQMQDYAAAVEWLCSADKENFASLQQQKQNNQPTTTLADLLADTFFLMQGQNNSKMMKKSQAGDMLLPQKVGFFVPGQYYIERNYAVVFTREIYNIAHQDTGPVRDDPRKLWIDPTNALSKVRDEAYFKQWWEWEGDQLIMPGLLWMIKENEEWRIDLFSGVVPRLAFRKILRWHFGRDVLEEEKKEPTSQNNPPPQPTPSPPAQSESPKL